MSEPIDLDAIRARVERGDQSHTLDGHVQRLLLAAYDAKAAEVERLRTALADIYGQGCFPGVEPGALRMWNVAREALGTTGNEGDE